MYDTFKNEFIDSVFKKLKLDLKDKKNRKSALDFLLDVSAKFFHEKRFMQFLSENIGYKYKTQRLVAQWNSTNYKNNGNQDVHYHQKLIKSFTIFGCSKKTPLSAPTADQGDTK